MVAAFVRTLLRSGSGAGGGGRAATAGAEDMPPRPDAAGARSGRTPSFNDFSCCCAEDGAGAGRGADGATRGRPAGGGVGGGGCGRVVVMEVPA